MLKAPTMVTIVEKSNGRRLPPWKVADMSFHAGEERRASLNELVHSAHIVPEGDRKKWNGMDVFEPGEIFYINTPTGEGPERTPNVYHEPVVALGDHYEVLDRKTNKLVRKVTHAIVVPKKSVTELPGVRFATKPE